MSRTAAEPRAIATNPIHLGTLPDAFTPDGLEADGAKLLPQLGVANLSELVGALHLTQGGVQAAPVGAIQDPAGVAIGAGVEPIATHAGGASAAIYSAFPDLRPIPQIQPRSAVFNSSTGAGHRVLHTHSPELAGSPRSTEPRRQAMEDLANAYANALEAFRDRAADLGEHGTLLNLVPVSAGIFAGDFVVPALGHLHPSYTICATVLALNWWRGTGSASPSLTIYFFEPPVYDAALAVAAKLVGDPS